MKTRAPARKFLRALLVTLLFAKLSLAQTAFSLEVERSESALGCPDADWFRARVAAHHGRSGQAGKFRVTLERSGETWQARIQSWDPRHESQSATERVLEDRSTACEPLAQAVTVTVAILAEDHAQWEAAPVVRPEPARAAAPPLHTPVRVAAAAPELRIWIGGGAGAAAAWISPVAPVLGLGVALDSKHLRQAVRVMLTTPQNFDLYPGRVVVQAWLASMLSCVRLARGDIEAALCAAFDAGMLRGRAEGFAESTPSTRGYEAVGLELQPSWNLATHFRFSASLAAMLPFSRESFSVTGRGVAYVPPALNGRALIFAELGVF